MYSLHIINKGDIENLCNLPGLLLIDEAENHLHPTWQKTFIKSILEIFPNLQIIVTTHSPFIVSSVDHVKVYVCNSKTDHVIISDETDIYSNKPVEEILLSPLFGTTY
jgi:Predicted ATP-binding protein involved in virulence